VMSMLNPVTPVWKPMYSSVEWSMQSPISGKSMCSVVTDHPSGSIDLRNCDMIVLWYEDGTCRIKHCSRDRDLISWMIVD
jgi:hypothetical protein